MSLQISGIFCYFKASAMKESSFGTDGDRQTFFDQIFNFCLHNIIVRKVLSNFCFWGPIRFVYWLEIDPVPSWRPGFFGLTGKPDLKKFYLFKDKSFDLKSFLFFRATHALRFYTFSVVGGLQISFLVRFEGVCLYIFIPVEPPNFHKNWSISAREFQYLLIFAYIKPLN